MNIYLYKKTHKITGLKYLGKTSNTNPHKYKGSGKRWLPHINKHGYLVETEILKICQTNDEVKYWGQYYSNLWNVVEDPSWANLKPEEGDGGNCGPEGIEKMSKTKQGNVPWNKGKTNLPKQSEETKRKRAEKLLGQKRNDAFKEQMSKLHKGRKRTPEQNLAQSIRKKGKKLSPEHNAKKTLAQTGLKRPILTCPHCGKQGGKNGMTRYHFDNCHTIKL